MGLRDEDADIGRRRGRCRGEREMQVGRLATENVMGEERGKKTRDRNGHMAPESQNRDVLRHLLYSSLTAAWPN